MSGQVQPNGQKVRELREAKGWEQEVLADKADCSLRTVQKIEGGAKCYKATLTRLADALGTAYWRLLSNPSPPESEVNLYPPLRAELVIIVRGDLKEIDETTDLPELLRKIAELAKLRDVVEVLKVERSKSFEVGLELTESDVIRLLAAFHNGEQLAALGIQDIRVLRVIGDKEPPAPLTDEDVDLSSSKKPASGETAVPGGETAGGSGRVRHVGDVSEEDESDETGKAEQAR